jgi:hypothetical protein
MGDKFVNTVKGVVQSTSLIGSAWAGQEAADAQGQIAEAQLNQQRSDRDRSVAAAEPTPQEIAQLNRAIALNESDVIRKEKLLASSDPALIEAGKQALELLNGAEAKTLGPLKSKIAKEEQTLRQRLAAQLGPGYENTTAGLQALQAFNEQSSNALSTAQNQTLGQLLGVAQDTSSRYGNQTNIANAGTFSSLFGNQSARRVNAITGSPITNAGAQFVGDLQSARNAQQTFGQILQIAGIASGAGAFNTGAKASPTASTQTAQVGNLNNNYGMP